MLDTGICDCYNCGIKTVEGIMATLDRIERNKNWASRPTDNSISEGTIWCVEKGEEYDLVQFTIKEIDGYYWNQAVAFPVDADDNFIAEEIKGYCESIPEYAVKEYRSFLDFGNKYGWD